MLYLILSGEYLKIGSSDNLKQRLKGYDTHNPDYKLLELRPGGFKEEKELQFKFKDLLYKGEWLYYSNEIIDTFKSFEFTSESSFNYIPENLNKSDKHLNKTNDSDIIVTEKAIEKLLSLSARETKVLIVFLKYMLKDNILEISSECKKKIMSDLRKPIYVFDEYLLMLLDQEIIIQLETKYVFNPDYFWKGSSKRRNMYDNKF